MKISKICKDLLNDLDRLPKQTMSINAEGNKGETRSINIPVQYKVVGYLRTYNSKCNMEK